MVYTVFRSFLLEHEKLLLANLCRTKFLIAHIILVSFNYLTDLMVH